MNFRWIGAFLVIVGCGGVGISAAAAHRKEEQTLRYLISALDLMECELQFHLTPLPDLCRMAGLEAKGAVREILLTLSTELERQSTPEVSGCMNEALAKCTNNSPRIYRLMKQLGQSLGRFDLTGQMKGLESVRGICRQELEHMNRDRDNRLRSYQTLGLCAGAALAILLV